VTDLSILIPVLRRPENAARQFDDIVAATEGDYEVVFITTATDVEECRAVDFLRTSKSPRVRHLSINPNTVGDYAKKINFAVRNTTSRWLFTGADDLHFHPGWFPHAVLASASKGCRVIGTQDLGNRRVMKGEHSTHSLVDRSYIDEMGTIDERGKLLHEGYVHEFVDDEFVETARHRDEFVFAWNSIVEHLHPLWGKAPTDELYEGHRKRMNLGRRVYTKRKPLWTSR